MIELKVRKFGNSLGVLLPKEVIGRLNAAESKRLLLIEAEEGEYRLVPDDPTRGKKVKPRQSWAAPQHARSLGEV
jgi:antitoxin component of MazEF toxin-antitoxin module